MMARVGAMIGFVLLSACATSRPAAVTQAAGSELIGRQLRVETARGQVSTLHFAPGGVVHARFGEREITGQWHATGEQLCFAWAGASRECWPYRGPLEAGETVSITSDRGNVVRVTLQ